MEIGGRLRKTLEKRLTGRHQRLRWCKNWILWGERQTVICHYQSFPAAAPPAATGQLNTGTLRISHISFRRVWLPGVVIGCHQRRSASIMVMRHWQKLLHEARVKPMLTGQKMRFPESVGHDRGRQGSVRSPRILQGDTAWLHLQEPISQYCTDTDRADMEIIYLVSSSRTILSHYLNLFMYNSERVTISNHN